MSMLTWRRTFTSRFVALVTGVAFTGLTCLPAFCSVAEAEQRRVRYFHPDHLGSSVLVTDEQGNVIERVQYRPFGEVYQREIRNPATGQMIAVNEAARITPFGFTG